MAKPKILVVDDDIALCEALPIFFKNILDCEVVVKTNGSEAIRAIDESTFDLIIQDLQMPGVDGFRVLEHVIGRQPGIKRIVLTGMVDPAVTKKVEDMGAIYVSKPPELKALELVVLRELKVRRA